MYEDNTAAIDMVKSPYIKRGARHIDIQMILEMVYIPSAKQEADGLTKIRSPLMFEAWRDSKRMCSMAGFQKQ